jgi:hypothetical protein
MTTCTLRPNGKPFNENSLEQLNSYYNIYVKDSSLSSDATIDRKKNFNICLLQYNKDTTANTNENIEDKLNQYENELNDTNNANSINENTISLYNNDLVYVILKFCVLFLILGIVYVIYVKNLSLSNAFEGLKNKTINITQKINSISQPIAKVQQVQVKTV